MDFFIDKLDYFFAALGALLSWFFGGLDGFILALLTFSIMDYATGLMAAGMRHELSSRIGFDGIKRKIGIFVLVGVAHVVDQQLLPGESEMFRDAVIFFYLANEGLSIIENAGALGLPIPGVLKKTLAQLRDKNNDKEEKESSPKGTDNKE